MHSNEGGIVIVQNYIALTAPQALSNWDDKDSRHSLRYVKKILPLFDSFIRLMRIQYTGPGYRRASLSVKVEVRSGFCSSFRSDGP